MIESNGHYGLVDASNPYNDSDAGSPGNYDTTIAKCTVVQVMKYLDDLNIKSLDFIVATHSHYDHIGGMKTIANKYVNSNTKYYYRTYVKTQEDTDYPQWNNQRFYNKSVAAMENAGAELIEVTNKTVNFSFGNFTINILNTEEYGPNDLAYAAHNNNSLAYSDNANSLGVLVTKNNVRAFLAGDIESYDEMKVKDKICTLGSGNCKVQILKAGHHLYSEATSYEFIKALQPKVVISTNNKQERFDTGNDHMNYGAMLYMIDQYNTSFYATSYVKADSTDSSLLDAVKVIFNDDDYLVTAKPIGKSENAQLLSNVYLNNIAALKNNNTWYRIASDKRWLYLKNNTILKNNWQQSSDVWYYFGDDGVTVTGEQTIYSTNYNKNFEYVFDSSCKMVTGWKANSDGINWNYYATASTDNYPEGSKIYSNWIYSAEYWYYINEFGNMVKGIFNDGKNKYYFNPVKNDKYPSGAMMTKWVEIDGSYYYFNPTKTDTLPQGAMIKDDWVKDNDKWYYMGADGKMLTGRHLLDYGDGNMYYYTFDDTGALVSREDEVDYTITYDLAGGTVDGNPISYTINTNDITLKNPTKIGYTFVGWTGSNGKTKQMTVVIKKGSTGNKNYIANWTANKDTKYVVNHYIYDNENGNYKLHLSESLKGTTGKKIVLAELTKSIDNYTYISGYLIGDIIKPTSGAVKSTTIKADGSTVINLYYIVAKIDISAYSVTPSNIINRLSSGTRIGDFKNNITITDGMIQIVDKDDNPISDDMQLKTGYKLKAYFNNDLENPIIYPISVIGDVLGEGRISLNGVKTVARHIIDKNVLEDEYLTSADYNGDGVVKMNDVMRMLR